MMEFNFGKIILNLKEKKNQKYFKWTYTFTFQSEFQENSSQTLSSRDRFLR